MKDGLARNTARHGSHRWVLRALLFGSPLACGCPGAHAPPPGESSPPPPPNLEVERLPMAKTPVTELSTEELIHTELLRIGRNFGKTTFEIALDAWVAADVPGELADVRLWWARSDRDLERSPFGEGTKGNFEIEYEQPATDHWRVHIVSGGKRFTFEIEVGDDGKPRAYAEVETGAGTIRHCHATAGVLHARRLLGAPIGIKKLEVRCTDDDGTAHEGSVAGG